jgi:hypothetical protein
MEIEDAENNRKAETLTRISTLSLRDLNQYFMPKKGTWDWTWSMMQQGRRIIS